MPKAKPSLEGGVIVHRIELQESERDTLKLFLMGKTVTNGLNGAGTLLNGLSPIIAAIVAWWVAQFTFEEFKQWIDDNIGAIRSAHFPHVAEAWDYIDNGLASLSWFTDEETGTWRDAAQIGILYDNARIMFGSRYTEEQDIDFSIGFMIEPFIDNFKPERPRLQMMEQNKTVQDAWREWWPKQSAVDKATNQGTWRNMRTIPGAIMDSIFGSSPQWVPW